MSLSLLWLYILRLIDDYHNDGDEPPSPSRASVRSVYCRSREYSAAAYKLRLEIPTHHQRSIAEYPYILLMI